MEIAGHPSRAAFRSLSQQSGLPLERIVELAEKDSLITAVRAIPRHRLEQRHTAPTDEPIPHRKPMSGAHAKLALLAKRWPG